MVQKKQVIACMARKLFLIDLDKVVGWGLNVTTTPLNVRHHNSQPMRHHSHNLSEGERKMSALMVQLINATSMQQQIIKVCRYLFFFKNNSLYLKWNKINRII